MQKGHAPFALPSGRRSLRHRSTAFFIAALRSVRARRVAPGSTSFSLALFPAVLALDVARHSRFLSSAFAVGTLRPTSFDALQRPSRPRSLRHAPLSSSTRTSLREPLVCSSPSSGVGAIPVVRVDDRVERAFNSCRAGDSR
jgi:hypothetical protein